MHVAQLHTGLIAYYEIEVDCGLSPASRNQFIPKQFTVSFSQELDRPYLIDAAMLRTYPPLYG